MPHLIIVTFFQKITKIIAVIIAVIIPLSLHAGETVTAPLPSAKLLANSTTNEIAATESAEAGDKITGQLDITGTTRYVDRYSLSISQDASVQTTLTLFYKNWSAYIWHTNADEVDSTIDYESGPLENLSNMIIGGGVQYWNFADLGGTEGDCIVPYFDVKKEFENVLWGTLEPYIHVEWALPVSGSPDGSANSFAVMFGAKHTAELTAIWDRLGLEQTLEFTRDDGAFGYQRGIIASYEIKPTFKITEDLTGFVSVRVIGPIVEATDRNKYTIVSIGCSWTF